MPAMHDDVMLHMRENLERKKDIMLRLNPFSMTHEELLSLVCTKEDAEVILRASKIVEERYISPYSQSTFTVSLPAYVDGVAGAVVGFTMRTHAYKNPPLNPLSPHWQFPENAKQNELAGRVINWMDKRLEIGRKFGMVRHVLGYLNQVCTHGSQLTYLMPSVAHLCERGRSTRMDTWTDKFGAYKPVKNAPALSLEMRRATGDAAALLTSCAMIGTDVPEPPEGEVHICAYALPSIKFGDGYVSRM